MEMNPPPPRTKLQATMARRANPRDLGAEALHYDAEPEPNMRLSRAIAVVLILHIVAIGGVLAFSLIKDRAPQPTTKTKPVSAAPAPATAPGTSPAAAIVAATGLIPSTSAKRSEPAIQTEKSPAVTQISTTTSATPPKMPQKTTPYVVRQGDTLARVASEHGVSLGALIAVNEARVTTTNLKPGQEIQLPVLGAPKDRPQEEAARLIEMNGPAKPGPALAKATTPISAAAKPPLATPIPATLVAKPTTSALHPPPAPELTHTKSISPPPTMAKATTPPPNMAKSAKPEPKVEKAIPVKATESKPTAGSASWEAQTYVVVAGDNPEKLARKFGVTENALLKANGISDSRKLQIGQRIVIPSRKPKH
jgi:LysM repeat protein